MNPEAVDAVVESIRRDLCPDVDPFIIFSAIEPQLKDLFDQACTHGFKTGMESAAELVVKTAEEHERHFAKLGRKYAIFSYVRATVTELKHVSNVILHAAEKLTKPEDNNDE